MTATQKSTVMMRIRDSNRYFVVIYCFIVAEAANAEALHQTLHPRRGYKSAPMLLPRILVAITAGLSDNNLSYNPVKMTQTPCFLMVAMALSRDLVPAQLVDMAPNRDHFKATETASH